MPTGYTQKIIDGEVKTAKDFLHLCLRNFGVCIELKDEPFTVEKDYSDKITQYTQETIDWHLHYLKSARKRIKDIRKMSDDQLYKKYVQEKTSRMESTRETVERETRINETYDKFIQDIEKWDCSPEFKGIKDFALEQLEKSKCTPDYFQAISDTLSQETYNKKIYVDSLIKDIQWDIDYHTKEIQREKKLLKERLDFYKNFKKELKKLK